MDHQTEGKTRVSQRNRRLLFAGTIIALIVLGWNYLAANSSNYNVSYRFATAKRADFKISTLATGRVKAVDAVEVSSQLSGQVVKLDADFNSKVQPGSPLARLDDKTFKAAVAAAQAKLAHAKASFDTTLAKTAGANARYVAAQQDYQRKIALKNDAAFSAQELDKTRSNMLTAKSALNAALADEAVQKATIEEAKAALQQAQINLERTVIRSPIAGIVINRTVELGQTVAVSMQAPTLFTIARDLKRMRVHAIVDEADIGRIRVGQHAQFSVDAHPNRSFVGQVIEIHRAPKIVQNVVTYTVVITAENHDLALLPGMTTIVHIVTTDRSNALVVPNAALRFQPEVKKSNSLDQRMNAKSGLAHIWVGTDSGRLSRADIRVGASNGSMTEVISGPLSKGQAVAVGREPALRQKGLFGIRLGF